MGIFKRGVKTSSPQRCDVCDETYVPGTGRPHIYSHITRISWSEPRWLPESLRATAVGEYIFECGRCNSFPAMHWPSEIGAYSGMNMHLAAAHDVGILASSVTGIRASSQFDMLPIQEPEPTYSAWAPTVEMSSARPAVFALAQAPAMNDAQVRSAIAELARLSDMPTAAQAQRMIGREPDAMARPWKWLNTVMREAQGSSDYALAAAGLLWALHWTVTLVPKLDTDSFVELSLYPIPAPLKGEIQKIGIGALGNLPDDFVVAGDETGQVLAGVLARNASYLLS